MRGEGGENEREARNMRRTERVGRSIASLRQAWAQSLRDARATAAGQNVRVLVRDAQGVERWTTSHEAFGADSPLARSLGELMYDHPTSYVMRMANRPAVLSSDTLRTVP